MCSGRRRATCGRRAGVVRETATSTSDSDPSGTMVAVTIRLAVRAPFASDAVMSFIGDRAIPGVESWQDGTYRRSLDLPGGVGVVELVAHSDHVAARLELSSWSDLGAATQRVRRLLDLDSDPVAVDAALGSDPALAALVEAAPGRRAPASVDPYETAVRAVIGQQVSVAGARTVAGRITQAVGRVLLAAVRWRHPFVSPTRGTRSGPRRRVLDAGCPTRHDPAARSRRRRWSCRTRRRQRAGGGPPAVVGAQGHRSVDR